ncbi:hypothetical protein [Dapis sp. BLCC M229]
MLFTETLFLELIGGQVKSWWRSPPFDLSGNVARELRLWSLI